MMIFHGQNMWWRFNWIAHRSVRWCAHSDCTCGVKSYTLRFHRFISIQFNNGWICVICMRLTLVEYAFKFSGNASHLLLSYFFLLRYRIWLSSALKRTIQLSKRRMEVWIRNTCILYILYVRMYNVYNIKWMKQ